MAESVANDWANACACLERTVGSILANRRNDVRAMVVGQNRPPIHTRDERYLFVETNLPIPGREDTDAKNADKGGKIAAGFQFMRDLPVEYVMVVDGDDLISDSLIPYVYARPEFDAFCLKVGYEWRVGTSYVTLRRSFNQACGSTFVWRFDARLFPTLLGGGARRVADQNHAVVEAAMDREGFRVDKIFEPKAVYVTGHANHVSPEYHRITFRRWIKDSGLAPWRRRRLTAALRAEFGLSEEAT